MLRQHHPNLLAKPPAAQRREFMSHFARFHADNAWTEFLRILTVNTRVLC